MNSLTTPEQAVVDQVRIALTEFPHQAGPNVAGAMVISRWAYRAGKERAQDDSTEPTCLIGDALPKTINPITETAHVNEVYKRTFDHVIADPQFTKQALWAFYEGQKAKLHG